MLALFCLGATLAFIGIFFILYKRNRYRLVVSFTFLLSVAFAALTILFSSTGQDMQNKFLQFFYAIFFLLISILIFSVFIFGIYILIFLLFLNARSMLKKERRTLANSLTLLIAIALLLFVILSWAMAIADNVPVWLQAIYSGFVMVLAYFIVHILLFFTSILLCNFSRPKKNQQYIVILGCGLVNGKVSTLLAKRVDALSNFTENKRKRHRHPFLCLAVDKVLMNHYQKPLPCKNMPWKKEFL